MNCATIYWCTNSIICFCFAQFNSFTTCMSYISFCWIAVYAHCFPVIYIIRRILCSLLVMPRLVIRMFSSHSKRKRPFILSFWNFFLYRSRPIVVSKLSNWVEEKILRHNLLYNIYFLCYLFHTHGRQTRFVCLGFQHSSRDFCTIHLAVRWSWFQLQPNRINTFVEIADRLLAFCQCSFG